MKQVALITGSSRGIGRAVALELSQAGYAVCINYIQSREAAESLAAQLCGEGREAADETARPSLITEQRTC